MLLRLVYLAVTNTFSFMRLLPVSERAKEIEILVLRHQLMVLQRQVAKPVFTLDDRFLLSGLLHRLLVELRQLVLLVRPDTLLCWHRDLLRRRNAAASVPCGAQELESSPALKSFALWDRVLPGCWAAGSGCPGTV